MSNIQEQVIRLAKKISLQQYRKAEYRCISISDVVLLDSVIESKIRQNERERAASTEAAARCIVGGK